MFNGYVIVLGAETDDESDLGASLRDRAASLVRGDLAVDAASSVGGDDDDVSVTGFMQGGRMGFCGSHGWEIDTRGQFLSRANQ